jgi:hypothetical protein
VFTDESFGKGDFLLEYKGDLISENEAFSRELEYANDNLGCFMYYFCHEGQQLW